jgi:hypothetical protein
MSDEIDVKSFAQPVRLDDEPEFTPEELAHHDYNNHEGKKLVPKFKPQYIWSFDHTLAAFIDMGLTEIMRYPYNYPEDEIKRARDAFRAYATKDEGEFDPARGFVFENINSPEYAETMWAFDWLKEHFTGLWT